MSEPSRKELIVYFERACDRFEGDLKAGRAGPANSYLEGAPEAIRGQLRAALEELAHAYQGDESPTMTVRRGRPLEQAGRPAVIARYKVEGEIGKGGMGEVYRAYDPDLDRHLAVKVMQRRHMGRPDALARFLLEARVLAQLEHPGVPPIHDVGRLPDGRPYYAMKLIRGETLADLMRAPVAERLPRLLAVFEQVSLTVAYAHSRGVVHRDLKPSNVMVGNFGEVQVMDWGLAKVSRERPAPGKATPTGPAPASITGTTDGTVMGTPSYMAPEQFAGDPEAVGAHTDVYGLGAILFELLTGRPPRQQAPSAEQPDWPREHATLRASAAGPPDLSALALRCLSPTPGDRPADAATVAAALAAYREKITSRGQLLERQQIIARLAATQLAQGAIEEAEASYREGLRLGPLSPQTVGLLVGLGSALRRKAPPDFPGAMEALREALRLDPACRAAHQGLGEVLLAGGRHSEAVQHLVKAFDPEDHSCECLPGAPALIGEPEPPGPSPPVPPEALYRRGRRALTVGDMTEAEACLRQAVAVTPDSPLVLQMLANALLKQGRYEEAACHLSQATSPPPGAASATPLKGWVGELDQAMRKAMERWREAYAGNRGG